MRLRQALWVGEFLKRNKVIRYADAQEALGVSMRTYRRILADLREAGFILDGNYGGHGRLGTHFIAWDSRLAPIREAVDNRTSTMVE